MTRPTPLVLTVARHNARRQNTELAEEAIRIAPPAPPRDTQRLRNIPVIGVGGAIPGTRPDHEILKRKKQRRRA